MLFTNACIENKTTLQDIRIRKGMFLEIGTKLLPEQGETVTDLEGRLVLPPFIESHVHLDTCLTAGDPVWNESGTLFEGIECWAKRKSRLNKADIRDRVIRAVRMYAAHGVQYIRTDPDRGLSSGRHLQLSRRQAADAGGGAHGSGCGRRHSAL